jgi:O-antigen/teichoic acid export membrane protein
MKECAGLERRVEHMGEVSAYKKEVAKGSFWSLIGNISQHVISFLYVILIARAVSQDDLGLFYLSLSVVTLVSVFKNLGLINSLTRYVPYFEGRNEIGKIRALLKTSYLVVTIASLLLMGILWWASDLIGEIYQNPHLPEVIRMLSALLILNGLFRVNIEYLRGRSDIKAMQFNSNIQNFLKLLFTFGFFYFYGASVFTLSGAYLLSVLVAIFFSFIFVRARIIDLPKQIETIPMKNILWEVLPFGLMLSFMHSLGVILSSTDRLLLGFLIEPAQSTSIVAIYSIATLLAMLSMIFPNSIGNIFLPVMSRLYGKKNLEQMRSVTQTAQRWSLFITLPVASILISFSAEMLEIFYGAAYVGGALVMSIFVIAVLIGSISTVLSLAFTSMKMVKLQINIILFVVVLNIILDVLLIPYFGMEGAAIAFLASSICTVLMYRYYAKKLFDFRFSPEFNKLLVAALITLLLVLMLKPTASSAASLLPQWDVGIYLYLSKIIYLGFLGVLTGIVFFIFMVFVLLLRCFVKEDIELMRKAMKKFMIPEFAISSIERIAQHGVAKS